MEPQDRDRDGRGRYEAQEILDDGSIGPRFLGKDRISGDTVVLQQLDPPAVGDEAQRMRDALAACAEGCEILRPSVLAVVESGPDTFLVCESIRGTTLEETLGRPEVLPPARVETCARRLGEDLARAHDRGIVHGALQPTSIAIHDDGACITDLVVRHLARCTGRLPRNPGDAGLDWRAWGQAVLAMATGVWPTQGSGDDPSAVFSGLQWDQELAADVRAALGGERPPRYLAPPDSPAPPTRRSRPPVGALVVLGLVPVAAAVAIFFMSQTPPDGTTTSRARPGWLPEPAVGANGGPAYGATPIESLGRVTPSDDSPDGFAASLDLQAPVPEPAGLGTPSLDSALPAGGATESGGPDGALVPVPPAVDQGPASDDARATWERAAVAIREGRSEAAMAATESLIADHPTDPGVWHLRACALVVAGRPRVAARVADAAAAADTGGALVWYNLGVARLSAGDSAAARNAFEQFIERAVDPAHAELRHAVEAWHDGEGVGLDP